MASKLGLSNEVKEIKLGQSFRRNDKFQSESFHTFRYDFMPASLDTKKRAVVDVGDGNQVTVTVPHIDGAGTANSVFKGSKKQYQKECVLIYDHITGDLTLEKLTYNVQLKDTRSFKGRSEGKRSSTPIENGFSSKRSPMPNKLSPQQKPHSTSLDRYSPIQKCSPLPKSPVRNQPSPNSSSNHSMPSLTNLTSKPPPAIVEAPSMPTPMDICDGPEIGVLSSSSSSGSSSSEESSDSSSSDNESEMPAAHKPQTVQAPPVVTNGYSPKKKVASNGYFSSPNMPSTSPSMPSVSPSMPSVTASMPSVTPSMPSVTPSMPSFLPSMPKFSQLSEDLQLSESDSDSD
ncbi:ell-associated factor Eaf [Caerostris darwini]|uniref:Ell-associated factor Eaf n=1 Tax=Caerostris darwini TaxID=1538125 RepID=A0AAV4WMI4_9ARAC|nr:ell-associated factor Eaf [Caerostris darwini]